MLCSYKYTKGKKNGENCIKNGLFKIGKLYYCGEHHKVMSNRMKNKKIAQNKGKGLNKRINKAKTESKQPQPNTESKKKSKYSLFMITINSNKDISKLSDEDQEKFKSFIGYLYDNNKPAILDLVEDRRKDIDPKDVIEEYSTENYNEISPKSGNRLHNHALLRIKHNGMLYVNQAVLREMAEKLFDSKFHINIKGANDSQKMIEQYISKAENY